MFDHTPVRVKVVFGYNSQELTAISSYTKFRDTQSYTTPGLRECHSHLNNPEYYSLQDFCQLCKGRWQHQMTRGVATLVCAGRPDEMHGAFDDALVETSDVATPPNRLP